MRTQKTIPKSASCLRRSRVPCSQCSGIEERLRSRTHITTSDKYRRLCAARCVIGDCNYANGTPAVLDLVNKYGAIWIPMYAA
eukprot:5674062-Amphidinium_carterae.1